MDNVNVELDNNVINIVIIMDSVKIAKPIQTVSGAIENIVYKLVDVLNA